jgi:hypothetical protein
MLEMLEERTRDSVGVCVLQKERGVRSGEWGERKREREKERKREREKERKREREKERKREREKERKREREKERKREREKERKREREKERKTERRFAILKVVHFKYFLFRLKF